MRRDAKEEVMELDFRMTEDSGCLEVVVSGSFDLDEAIEKFANVMGSRHQLGITKLLVDYTELNEQILVSEKIIYSYCIKDYYRVCRETRSPEIQMAFVFQSIMDNDPCADLAKTYDLPLSSFDDRGEAFGWLIGKDKMLPVSKESAKMLG